MDFVGKTELQEALEAAHSVSNRDAKWSTPQEVQKFTEMRVNTVRLRELVDEGSAAEKISNGVKTGLFKPRHAGGEGSGSSFFDRGPGRQPGRDPGKAPRRGGKDPRRRGKDPRKDPRRGEPEKDPRRGDGGKEPDKGPRRGEEAGKPSARGQLQNTLGRGIGAAILGGAGGGGGAASTGAGSPGIGSITYV